MTSQSNIQSGLSIGKKIAFSIIPAVAIGISAIIFILTYQMKNEVLTLSNNNNLTMTTLLKERIGGAVRWRKGDVIKEAYNNLVSQKDSTVANIVVFDNEGKIISSYTSSKLHSLNPAVDFKQFSSTKKKASQLTENFQTVAVPVFSGKKNEWVGSLVVAWSLEKINEDITASTTFIAGIGIFILAGLLVFLLALLNRIVTQPLAKMISLTYNIANGDGNLNQQLDINSKDELAVLAFHFNTFIEKVRSIIIQIRDCSNHLSDTANNTSQSVNESQAIMNKQSSEFVQVSTAINEMTSSIQEVAGTANNAASYADEANKKAKSGAELVIENRQNIESLSNDIKSATKFVEELAEDTKNIGGMLEVIRGIAEQTNLLALNAAIEAARAGEQGRGFAVVADEVRTLAGRTETATQDINKLIESLQARSNDAVKIMQISNEKSDNSVSKTNNVTDVLQEILDSISKMSDTNFQIASSSDEQTKVISTVNRNISTITQLFEKSEESSEKSTLAGRNMTHLASELKSSIAKFTV